MGVELCVKMIAEHCVDCSKRERRHHRPCFNPFFLFPFGFNIPLLCQVIPHFVPCCASRMYFGEVACLRGAECDGSLAADARLWRLPILNSGFSSSTAPRLRGPHGQRRFESQQAPFPHQSKYHTPSTKIFTPPLWSCGLAGPVEEAAAAFSPSLFNKRTFIK